MIMAGKYVTQWVCDNCIHHHANGECGDCHGDHGHDRPPLGLIGPAFHVTAGMYNDEHDTSCVRYPLECDWCTDPAEVAVWWKNPDGTHEGEPRCVDPACQAPPVDAVAVGTCPIPAPFPVPDGYECDCETNTFSTSQCDGCGSYLHGERHAMTLLDA